MERKGYTGQDIFLIRRPLCTCTPTPFPLWRSCGVRLAPEPKVGVAVYASTLPGGVTPTCNECGTPLCWDIPETQYQAEAEFWDDWCCEICNGGTPMSLKAWKAARALRAPAKL